MVKALLKSIREYKRYSLMAPMFAIIESAFDITVPTVMALLIDRGISAGSIPNMLKYGSILVASALVSLIMGFLAGRSTAFASAGFAKNLRIDIFHNIQKFSFANIDKYSTAGIITRLTTDVTNVQNAYQMIIRLGVRAPMLMFFALYFAFRINVRLSFIFLAVMPILAIGLLIVIGHVHPIFVRVFKTYDRLNNVVQENLLGIRVVKNYNREDHENEKFAKISRSIYANFVKATKRLAFNMPLMQFCVYASTLLLAWFGAKEILASGNNPVLGLSTGQLTSLITYTIQILMSLMLLSNVFVMIIISRASAERIVEILAEESDIKSKENPLRIIKDGSIAFEDVSFAYSRQAEKPVLAGINLSISSGETVGILGGTGSSKSSLVQLIPRLYDVTEGRVVVGGEDVRDYELEALRDQVAVVLQKNVLFSGTIAENLRWGKEDATEAEMVHACQLAQADEFIQALPHKYDSIVEQGGTNFSGGQRQRLCIARALLKRPKILILDDSTSAVDTKTDAALRQAFREALPDLTKIIIAQRVASVQDADKIIVLDDGRIDGVGAHDELLKSCQIYREVHKLQTRGGALGE